MLRHPYFDLCYSSTFIALDAPIEYVPCPRGSRYEGKSRMNSASLVLHGMRMLMPFIDRIAVRALALLSITSFVGIGLLVSVVVVKIFTDTAIPGWATYAAGAPGTPRVGRQRSGPCLRPFTVEEGSTSRRGAGTGRRPRARPR